MRSEIDSNPSLRYLFALLLAALMASGLVLYLYEPDSSAIMAGATAEKARSFNGGKYEASGVAYVRGTDGVLFVDDGKPGEVQWMRIDAGGNQVGPVRAVRLGVNIEDLEGITTDGSHFYVVNSQSKRKSAEQIGLVRFKFNPEGPSAEAVETISALKRLLVENVAELRGMADVKAKDDGINIEGLAWDPTQGQLLLGLRSPVMDGNALIVPLKLRDPAGAFSPENVEMGAVIRVSLRGNGIRSIEYDEQSKLFQIVSGATETQDKTEFKLWEWGGPAAQSQPREVATFDRDLKAEGVARAQVGDSSFTIVVFDTSRYMVTQ
ncbi:MAG TPA: DUF3616 domain-containing protein [Blastocatellia bacterium]|nr:DUF3616 domain-containing protein [Blastocatellia bacterium]